MSRVREFEREREREREIVMNRLKEEDITKRYTFLLEN